MNSLSLLQIELDGLSWLVLEDIFPGFLIHLVGKLAVVIGCEFSVDCWLKALVSRHVGTSTRLLVLPYSMVGEFQESILKGRK